MSNGYKPAPLDLSDVKLLPPQEILVDKLAENAHNVWAKDRIKQGWTYGIQQVSSTGSGMLEKLGDVIIHQSAILHWWVLDWKTGKSSVRVQADAPCECRGPGAVETLRRAADHSHVGM